MLVVSPKKLLVPGEKIMKKLLSISAFWFAIVLVSIVSVSAQDTMMKKDEMKKGDAMMKKDEMKKDDAMMKKDDSMMMKFNKELPTVAVIKADWCPYCKNVDPVLTGVLANYKGKVNVVMFDVTNDATKAEAMKMAAEYGLAKFYKSNKDKTSTVAVLIKDKIKFKTSNNTKESDYTSAINKALMK
jgi:thiol-disulfide isomerase/thioredoxin